MSVFSRFALRSLAKNRTRTIVSVIGIALSCALITAVLTSVVSIQTLLAERTAADEGTWQVEAAGLSEQGLSFIEDDDRIADHLEVAELGTIDLGSENAADYGNWLFAKTWPADDSGHLVALPKIESGRAPEAPGEVILPHYLDGVELAPCGLTSTGPISVGSTLTAELGTRTVRFVDSDTGEEQTVTGTSDIGSYYDDETTENSFTPDLGTRAYTVVGFYRSYGFSATRALGGNCLYTYDDGTAAAAALVDDVPATTVSSLFSLKRAADVDAVTAELTETDDLAQGGVVTHNTLLRWQGVTGSADIWDTLYGIAAILAAVILVAGISLVYNAFAISVAERTRQFGLLSSLGASRRQLRRTVLTESLVLGAIGIPLGVVLGLLGCLVVFTCTGEGLAAMFDVNTYGVEVRVVVDPVAIALSAALALATLLVSAWLPARRASRVSAVDAIRQTQDVRLTGRARRKLTRTARCAKTETPDELAARPRGLAAQLFGVPGFVAHRNLSRSASKGRVTVSALAISVALLIISGSIASVLGYASSTALNTVESVDLSVRIDATASAGTDGALLREDGTYDNAGIARALERLAGDTADIEGARQVGYGMTYIADALIPANMVSASGSAQFFGTMLQDGGWSGPVYVEYIDDGLWRSYVEERGLSAKEFCDPAAPRAIALNRYDVNDAGIYSSYSPISATGQIESLSFANLDGFYAGGVVSDENGERAVWYNAPDGSEQFVPLGQAIAASDSIEVGALADAAPTGLVAHGRALTLILPLSAIDLTRTMGFGNAWMNFDCAGSGDAASRAEDAISTIAEGYPELDCAYTNYAAAKMQTRMMADTVQTFIYCFTVICGLIAVTNVFNTLTNSLILRRREFAVLKSIGMGNRAFRRMIAYECMSYALRGFAIGLALGLGVTALLANTMSQSFATYALTVPWREILIAGIVVVAIIIVSCIYALTKSKSASIVESLRADAL